MESSNSKPPLNKQEIETLLKTARECWALACWLTLRRVWSQWETTRAGDEGAKVSQAGLPEPVQRFFGNYAHITYKYWIPIIQHETRLRIERDKKRHAAQKKKDGEDFEKLLKTEEPEIESQELHKHEEIAALLADERQWLAEGEESGGSLHLDNAESEDAPERESGPHAKLASHAVKIDEPTRPRDSSDKNIWEAWVLTFETLWTPTPTKHRVLMNELFKRPWILGDKVGTPSDFLRCLTGYLKDIIRETVRHKAREAIRVASNERIVEMDSQAHRHEGGGNLTVGDILPSKADIVGAAINREIDTRAEALAAAEFELLGTVDYGDGIRLGYFLQSLKKSKPTDYGFTVGIHDPAIGSLLDVPPATLYEHLEKSKRRITNAAFDLYPEEHVAMRFAIADEAKKGAMANLATQWFWSEKIDRNLFGVVMDLINIKAKSSGEGESFCCPQIQNCKTQPALPKSAPACWQCPRKNHSTNP